MRGWRRNAVRAWSLQICKICGLGTEMADRMGVASSTPHGGLPRSLRESPGPPTSPRKVSACSKDVSNNRPRANQIAGGLLGRRPRFKNWEGFLKGTVSIHPRLSRIILIRRKLCPPQTPDRPQRALTCTIVIVEYDYTIATSKCPLGAIRSLGRTQFCYV